VPNVLQNLSIYEIKVVGRADHSVSPGPKMILERKTKMRKILAVAAVLCMVSAASASATFYIDGPYDNGVVPGTVTYDLHPGLANERYQSSSIEADLTSGTFYTDAAAASTPLQAPTAFFAGLIPTLAFDTYISSPQSFPNLTTGDTATTFTPGSVEGPTHLAGGAFIAGNPYVDGDFVVIRLTVSADAVGLASGVVVTTENLAGYPYEIPIPEPSTMALLALGGLALIRRR